MTRDAPHTVLTLNASYPTPLFLTPLPRPEPPLPRPGNRLVKTHTEPFLNRNCGACAQAETALAWNIFSLEKSARRQRTLLVGTHTHNPEVTLDTQTHASTATLHTPSGRARGRASRCGTRTPRSAEPRRTHPQVPLGPLLILPAHGRGLSRTQPAAPRLTRPGHNFRPPAPEKSRLERLPQPSPSATHPALLPPHFRSRLQPRP